MRKLFISLSLLLGLILIVVGTVWYWNYSQDDVYITYRYSRNIAEGKGFVFNDGERVQGTTTPLFTLLMSGVYFLTRDLVHAGNFISALSLAGVCFLIFLLGKQLGNEWLGVSATLILSLNTWFYISFGMETLTYTLLLVAAFWFGYRQQDVAAGVCIGLLTITRADGILAAGVLTLTALIVRKRIPFVGGGVSAFIIATWYFFAWWYFGSPLPQTFNAKVGLFSGLMFLKDGFDWFQWLYLNYSFLYWLAPIFWISGVISSSRNHSYLIVIWSWSVLYFVAYTILNVSAFWYYAPLLPAIILTMGYGAWQIWKWFSNRTFKIAAAAVLLSLIMVAQVRAAFAYSGAPTRVETYRLVGEWLRVNTPSDALVLVGDLGVVSWYSGRRTIDVPGLVVPTMYVHDETYAIQKFKPDYIVATQYWTWKAILNEPWLASDYERITQISSIGDKDFSPMIVFRRRPIQLNQSGNQRTEQFGQDIKFLGVSDVDNSYWAGGEITLNLHWSLSSLTPQNYALFLHLLNTENQVVAQNDAWLGGDKPTSVRQVNENLSATHSVFLPPDLPEGSYKLILGVYNVNSGVREKLSDGADFIEIKTIDIQSPGGSGLP